jgi:hypothetical protein
MLTVLRGVVPRRDWETLYLEISHNSFDNIEVTLRWGSETLQRGLTGSIIVSRHRFLESFEFHRDDELVNARFEGLY